MARRHEKRQLPFHNRGFLPWGTEFRQRVVNIGGWGAPVQQRARDSWEVECGDGGLEKRRQRAICVFPKLHISCVFTYGTAPPPTIRIVYHRVYLSIGRKLYTKRKNRKRRKKSWGCDAPVQQLSSDPWEVECRDGGLEQRCQRALRHEPPRLWTGKRWMPLLRAPLLCGEGTTSMFLKKITEKEFTSRPELGLDCLIVFQIA